MDSKKKKCVESISKLLAENKLKEAFSLLDNYLSKTSLSIDFASYFVSASSQFYRTEKEYRLGTITWEQYNISNSQIVKKTLDLANELCSFINSKPEKETRDGHIREGIPPELRIMQKLRILIEEIKTLKPLIK